MTRWIVFEGGSRAGLSAKLFYLDYIKKNQTQSEMVLVDSDITCVKALKQSRENGIIALLENDKNVLSSDNVVFPADELTRQTGKDVNLYNIPRTWFNDVEKGFYNKSFVNNELLQKGIRIPDTFEVNEVLLKPNTLSAGSRGISVINNVCVQRKLDISAEYVVDATVDIMGKILGIVGREVKLRSGYDKYIRILPSDHPVLLFAKEIIASHRMFRGICHLQLCSTTEEGSPFYYIEGSKRISGTSLVNLLVGYNPFELISGKEMVRQSFDEGWYSYEDLLYKVQKMVYE